MVRGTWYDFNCSIIFQFHILYVLQMESITSIVIHIVIEQKRIYAIQIKVTVLFLCVKYLNQNVFYS